MVHSRVVHLYSIILALSITVTASAGVFFGTADCGDMSDCSPLSYLSDPTNTVPPFAVTHPPSYNGSGGTFTIQVCVLAGSEKLEGSVKRAMATWNQLVPTTGNCEGCKVWEEGPFTVQKLHAETTILHELGHCPLGLEHPDRNWDFQPDGVWEFTSVTRSWGTAPPPGGIDEGMDFIRGTFDDIQLAAAGTLFPKSVHWFLTQDAPNDPVALTNTIIDANTFSRTIPDLPAGHNSPANANRRVAETLGISNTQAVMYSLQVEGEKKVKLTADDVNMVQMAMTGQDFQAGTADDYNIQFDFAGVGSCDSADVIIHIGEVADPTSAAECVAGVDFSFPQNPFLAKHINVIPPGGTSQPFIITLNQLITWETPEIYSDGFESGDLSSWSAAIP